MNVLVLAPQSFYIDRGTPMDTDILLRALSERGERVDAAVYHEGEDRQYPGVTIHRIKVPRWLKNIGPGFSLKKLVCDLLLFFLVWKLMANRRYDVIHAGEESVFIAMFFRTFFGTPYVYDLDSSIAQQMVEQMGALRPAAGVLNRIEGLAIRNSIATAPVCNALGDLARRQGAPYIETLHDISLLSEQDFQTDGTVRRRLGLGDRLVMMYVGNLETYQGIDMLLDSFRLALQRGADLDLVVAGGSPDHIKKYQTKAASLGVGDRVHFIGPWPAAKLGQLLGEADILVAPRVKGINTPMKVFPYMHSGKPVLVTDLPTHSQILDQQVAMLAPPDPAGFADAIIRLSTDEALRQRLGESGKKFVERNHTFAAHRRRVDALYEYIKCTVKDLPLPNTGSYT